MAPTESEYGATSPRSTVPPDPVTDGDEEDEGVRPLSDRLMTELTAHRTLALREAIANDPDMAEPLTFWATCGVTHMALRSAKMWRFYCGASSSSSPGQEADRLNACPDNRQRSG
jgi:hypothetical protein